MITYLSSLVSIYFSRMGIKHWTKEIIRANPWYIYIISLLLLVKKGCTIFTWFKKKKEIKLFTCIRKNKKKNKEIVYRVIKIKQDLGTYITKLFKIRDYFLKQVITFSFAVNEKPRIKATFPIFFFFTC